MATVVASQDVSTARMVMAGTAALRGSWEDPGIWGGRGFDFCFQSRSAPNPRVEIRGEGGAPASGTARTGSSQHAVPEVGVPFARPVHGKRLQLHTVHSWRGGGCRPGNQTRAHSQLLG